MLMNRAKFAGLWWSLIVGACSLAGAADSTRFQGYYRFPAIQGDTIVFTAEGDLWRVGVRGGVAQRLTSHPGYETRAAFSPDGSTLAFSAQYDGPTEVYTMPVGGGLPVRRTFEGGRARVTGWTRDGRILYTTTHFSELPDWKLATVDLPTGRTEPLPLSEASDGVFDDAGKTLYFVRLQFQGSSTKRYQGGTAQQLWKYTRGAEEAVPLTTDFPGTSKNPMWWHDRVYFISDRDGTMNLWSMNPAGADRQQLTHNHGWDVKAAALDRGRIVYTQGADLYLFDIAAHTNGLLPITLASDFDQERERWVKKPMDYLTAAHLSPDGDRVALTARGQVFVAPVKPGRFIAVTHDDTVRYREAQFMPDGKALLAISDASGDLEFGELPANGKGAWTNLTQAGKGFRFKGTPSPDGQWIAYADKDFQLWLFHVADKKVRRIDQSPMELIAGLAWSPDSAWLAYERQASNTFSQIWLYNLKTAKSTAVTTDRVNSANPVWDPAGKWLYFLSDRHLKSVVTSPWGPREPEPFFDQLTGIYQVPLVAGLRSPFEPPDETVTTPEAEKPAPEKKKGKAKGKATDTATNTVAVKIELAGIQNRIQAVPVPPGNYHDLGMNEKNLLVEVDPAEPGEEGRSSLKSLELTSDEPKLKEVAENVQGYEVSADNKHLMIRQGDKFYVVAADAAPAKLEKSLALDNWSFPLNPTNEWRQMFTEAWRLERDYFYDPHMNGVDWPAVLQKYLPLVDRVTDRDELSDLMAEAVGELSALHMFVMGGDMRPLPEQARVAGLGARLERNRAGDGYRVAHIYKSDPDYPEKLSPLARPGVKIAEGDVLQAINGMPVAAVPDIGDLLRNQADTQVLLTVKPKSGAVREVIVKPVTAEAEADLRYGEWEYTRRLQTEKRGKGEIGYVHLRAMGAADIAQWTRDFYPVYNRPGLIIDVRHNNGGNIDSWILEKLLRKAWFFWQGRVGQPFWNMPYAFRGHVVVLCDERTASDGEAFSEGFKRLGLGKTIGTRTWGGEIWLSEDNDLVDKGMATAAEVGVYGLEGRWLIEGHGVDPDIVVDNLPHATFKGQDAQLQKAIDYLQEAIQREPVTIPPVPDYPDKSLK